MNNSLAEVHPELASEWSEKNLMLTPDDITFGSNKKVWWKGACGHEWQTSVKARSSGEKCPICSGARVIAGINDLATLEPLLAKQWSKKNKIKPTEVSIGSHKKVIWRCEKGHEWKAAVKSRTINKTGCPYCSHNKVLAGFNDFATLLPDIAAEWSDRNYPLLPTQVTVFANRKAWWKCKDCGREWNTLTDFWRVGKGYAKKLEEHGLFTMGDIARCSIGKSNELYNEELLYKLFGINAELLIDHAWGSHAFRHSEKD